MGVTYTFSHQAWEYGTWGYLGMSALVIYGFGLIPLVKHLSGLSPNKRLRAALKAMFWMTAVVLAATAMFREPHLLEAVQVTEDSVVIHHSRGPDVNLTSGEVAMLQLEDNAKQPAQRGVTIQTKAGETYYIGPFSAVERDEAAARIRDALGMVPCMTGELCWAKRPQ